MQQCQKIGSYKYKMTEFVRGTILFTQDNAYEYLYITLS